MKINMNWWETKLGTAIVAWSMVIGLLMIPMSIGLGWGYVQRYVADNNETATKGIMFQKTIYLKGYKLLGNGNGIYGDYKRYSRSDRHGDVISVYKD